MGIELFAAEVCNETLYSLSLLKGQHSVNDCFEFAFSHQPGYDLQLIAVGLHSCGSILGAPS